jgi:hypothetical protein
MTTTAVPLRLGRNLKSLTFTSDPTDRATRLMPLTGTVGGSPTYLGYARWKVANVAGSGLIITLADPAGGAGPIGFDNQTIGWFLFREKTGQSIDITDSVAGATQTVTLSATLGLTVGEFVQFRTTSVAGVPVPDGAHGALSGLSRGYVLPLLATAIASNDLTIAFPTSGTIGPLPSANDQYVGDDAAFSFFQQTSVGDFIGTATWPNYTINWVSGTNFSGLAVGDWLITGDLSVWEGGSGQGLSLPPMTVTHITDSTHINVTIRGDGPTFNQGAVSVALQFFRPAVTNPSSKVTASTASPRKITVASASTWTASSGAPGAIELSFTPRVGELPYYLDHPLYIASSFPGIGVKFGTIDRSEFVSVANLVSNSVLRDWSAGVPVGWTVKNTTTPAATVLTQITDPLYTVFGGSSALVDPTLATGGRPFVVTPPIAWKPTRAGERFSVRLKVLMPTWSGAMALRMFLGVIDAAGNVSIWNDQSSDTFVTVVPPDHPSPPANAKAIPAGVSNDLVLQGFDITAASKFPMPGLVGVSPDELAAAVGFVVVVCPYLGTIPAFYLQAVMVTPTFVPPDVISEFGDANKTHQSTNVALNELGKPQVSFSADLVDLQRMTLPLVVGPDDIKLGRFARIDWPDMGIVGELERMVEVTRNHLVPGDTRITVARRTKRMTDILLSGHKQAQATSNQIAAVQGTASGTSSGGTPTTVGTPPVGVSSGYWFNYGNLYGIT